MKITYLENNLRKKTMYVINLANTIIREYRAQGFDLTLRQLYYQLVARDYIPNNDRSYKRVSDAISKGRLAGLIDWNAIVDRTRNLQGNTHWDSPDSVLGSCAYHYQIDKWVDQPYRPEVWIEKDALVGVISGICTQLDIPFFACRGYTSQSEMWRAGQRILDYIEGGQIPFIIHLGDHDPSGIDMSRDIIDRLEMFVKGTEGLDFNFIRLALNNDQVRQYKPPPNPAKLTDSRIKDYISQFGRSSWELDALEPNVIVGLIREHVLSIRDETAWQDKVAEEAKEKRILQAIHTNVDQVVGYLKKDGRL